VLGCIGVALHDISSFRRLSVFASILKHVIPAWIAGIQLTGM
jgi:hypothetical protein